MRLGPNFRAAQSKACTLPRVCEHQWIPWIPVDRPPVVPSLEESWKSPSTQKASCAAKIGLVIFFTGLLPLLCLGDLPHSLPLEVDGKMLPYTRMQTTDFERTMIDDGQSLGQLYPVDETRDDNCLDPASEVHLATLMSVPEEGSKASCSYHAMTPTDVHFCRFKGNAVKFSSLASTIATQPEQTPLFCGKYQHPTLGHLYLGTFPPARSFSRWCSLWRNIPGELASFSALDFCGAPFQPPAAACFTAAACTILWSSTTSCGSCFFRLVVTDRGLQAQDLFQSTSAAPFPSCAWCPLGDDCMWPQLTSDASGDGYPHSEGAHCLWPSLQAEPAGLGSPCGLRGHQACGQGASGGFLPRSPSPRASCRFQGLAPVLCVDSHQQWLCSHLVSGSDPVAPASVMSNRTTPASARKDNVAGTACLGPRVFTVASRVCASAPDTALIPVSGNGSTARMSGWGLFRGHCLHRVRVQGGVCYCSPSCCCAGSVNGNHRRHRIQVLLPQDAQPDPDGGPPRDCAHPTSSTCPSAALLLESGLWYEVACCSYCLIERASQNGHHCFWCSPMPAELRHSPSHHSALGIIRGLCLQGARAHGCECGGSASCCGIGMACGHHRRHRIQGLLRHDAQLEPAGEPLRDCVHPASSTCPSAARSLGSRSAELCLLPSLSLELGLSRGHCLHRSRAHGDERHCPATCRCTGRVDEDHLWHRIQGLQCHDPHSEPSRAPLREAAHSAFRTCSPMAVEVCFHPASLQSWVSIVDIPCPEPVPMEENAAVRLPVVVLEWHADTICGTEYKVFDAGMHNLNQTGNLLEIVRTPPRSRALQLQVLLNPGSGL